jgi:phenol 2-monooxygenase
MTRVDASPYNSTRLNQGRIERFILDTIHEHSNLKVDRGVITESLEYDDKLAGDESAYPITVKLRTLGPVESNTPKSDQEFNQNDLRYEDVLPDDWEDLAERGKRKEKIETVKAKYLIGCDGAHSWTKKQLDIPLEGSSTDHIWLVPNSHCWHHRN